MKKMVVFFLISAMMTGCAFFQRKTDTALSPEDLKIKETIGNITSRIHANYSKAHRGNFSTFGEESYESSLKKLKSAKAKDMQDIYPIFKTKFFTASRDTFVFCGFSERLGIAFCDDAACAGTEYFERTTSADVLETWKTQLPLRKCAKK